jgi:hypothetical protein
MLEVGSSKFIHPSSKFFRMEIWLANALKLIGVVLLGLLAVRGKDLGTLAFWKKVRLYEAVFLSKIFGKNLSATIELKDLLINKMFLTISDKFEKLRIMRRSSAGKSDMVVWEAAVFDCTVGPLLESVETLAVWFSGLLFSAVSPASSGLLGLSPVLLSCWEGTVPLFVSSGIFSSLLVVWLLVEVLLFVFVVATIFFLGSGLFLVAFPFSGPFVAGVFF